jgi:hypothetical protein
MAAAAEDFRWFKGAGRLHPGHSKYGAKRIKNRAMARFCWDLQGNAS